MDTAEHRDGKDIGGKCCQLVCWHELHSVDLWSSGTLQSSNFSSGRIQCSLQGGCFFTAPYACIFLHEYIASCHPQQQNLLPVGLSRTLSGYARSTTGDLLRNPVLIVALLGLSGGGRGFWSVQHSFSISGEFGGLVKASLSSSSRDSYMTFVVLRGSTFRSGTSIMDVSNATFHSIM